MPIDTVRPDISLSRSYLRAARQVIPTGYNSAGRKRTEGLVFASARGGHLTDLNGNDYVDLVLGLGPIVIGHSEPRITKVLQRQVETAVILGAEGPDTLELAGRLASWIPSAERLLFANTGSEGIQVALRIARARTGRKKIVKFEGHYHGWLDPMFANTAGSMPSHSPSAEVEQVASSQGQGDLTNAILVTRWNNIEHLRSLVATHRDEIAALIMEPVPLNFGSYEADANYLHEVRELCDAEGILLIFDEVVSGFRLGKAGAQGRFGVTPDISVFAKAIASGVPLAMVAGTADAMTPAIEGGVPHLGTYNANPLSIAAANETTKLIEHLPDLYDRLEILGAELQSMLRSSAAKAGTPVTVNRVGSVLQLFWGVTGGARSYGSCATSHGPTIARIVDGMAHHGIHNHPRGIMFLAYRHTDADLEKVDRAFQASLAQL